MHDTILCLMGPTASGKTALACELVRRFPFEIISVDSAMIYKEMDIGTAKPNAAELALAPHHLIDILDPPESFSAAQFCEQATSLIEAIRARGNLPLLVGGTMMYFHALQQGLSVLPEADANLRMALIQKAQRLGWPALHAELKEQDPLAAEKIHPHDAQRIQRALEVYYASGKTVSSLRAEKKKKNEYEYLNIILFPENRAFLHQQIAERFGQMLELGFIEEVGRLLDKWQLPDSCPAMRCVGYRQAYAYLEGGVDYTHFCDKAIAATRQLAKRQLTWLRRWPEGNYFDKGMEDKILAMLGKLLDNNRL